MQLMHIILSVGKNLTNTGYKPKIKCFSGYYNKYFIYKQSW